MTKAFKATEADAATFVKNRRRSKARERVKGLAEVDTFIGEVPADDTAPAEIAVGEADTADSPPAALTQANTETRAECTKKIHALERKTIANTIEIGRLLQVDFDRNKHGDHAEYHAWVKTEFAWSERTSRNYRNLYEFQIGNSCQFEKLNITVSALYFLVDFQKADDLPDPWVKSAIDEVIREAKKKKRISKPLAIEMVDEHIAKIEAKQAELDAAAAETADDTEASDGDADDTADETGDDGDTEAGDDTADDTADDDDGEAFGPA